MNEDAYKVMPDQDFKEIDVVPGERQISQKERLIRRMPREGDLLTKSNYLDILFRLLHDDSIHDLRMGVNFMRNLIQGDNLSKNQLRRNIKKKLKEETSVKIYDDIYIQNLEVIEGARCVQFKMNMDKKRFVDWRISKKLLPGSLVILSNDFFASLFIGVLKNTDAI